MLQSENSIRHKKQDFQEQRPLDPTKMSTFKSDSCSSSAETTKRNHGSPSAKNIKSPASQAIALKEEREHLVHMNGQETLNLFSL